MQRNNTGLWPSCLAVRKLNGALKIMSQRDVAKMIDVSQPVTRGYAKRTHRPKQATKLKIAKVKIGRWRIKESDWDV